jgi:DNA-binding transcriptional regulator YiaG
MAPKKMLHSVMSERILNAAFQNVNTHMNRTRKKLTKLRKVRENAEITQVQLAALLRTDQSLVSKWEAGIVSPWPNTLTRIALALKVRESELT